MSYEEIVMEKYMDYCVARTHLVLRVSDHDFRKNHLKRIPHRRAADLAVTCHFMEVDETGRMGFTVVDQGLMEWMEISEDQLFSDAFTFGPRNLPPVIRPLEAMVEGILEGETKKKEELSFDKQLDAFDIRKEAAVLTNSTGIFGAASLFYPFILEMIGERMGGNYYIIPSSVHETILIPDNEDYLLSELEEMVWEINRTELMAEDWLSDSVYYYDRTRNIFARAASVKRN